MFAPLAKIVVSSLLGISTLTAAAHAAPPARDQVREGRQEARIGEGLATGELTVGEAVHLQREQARIDRLQRRARADGHVGVVEKARIEAAQDRASHDIYTLKHNRRAR